MVVRVSDKKKNYSKVTKLLVKPCTNHDNSGLNKIYKDDDVDNMIKDINEYIQNL